MTTRPRTPAPGTPAPGKLALPELLEMKRRGDRITMVTAYGPGGRLADAAGVELILVGDSAAMTVLGHDSTVPATVEEMLVLTRAVTRERAGRSSSRTCPSAPSRSPTRRRSRTRSASSRRRARTRSSSRAPGRCSRARARSWVPASP